MSGKESQDEFGVTRQLCRGVDRLIWGVIHPAASLAFSRPGEPLRRSLGLSFICSRGLRGMHDVEGSYESHFNAPLDADRLLVAQARFEPMILLTDD